MNFIWDKVIVRSLITAAFLIVPYLLIQIWCHISSINNKKLYAKKLIYACLKKHENYTCYEEYEYDTDKFDFNSYLEWIKSEANAFHISSKSVLREALKMAQNRDFTEGKDLLLQELYSLNSTSFVDSKSNFQYILTESKVVIYIIIACFIFVPISSAFNYFNAERGYYQISYTLEHISGPDIYSEDDIHVVYEDEDYDNIRNNEILEFEINRQKEFCIYLDHRDYYLTIPEGRKTYSDSQTRFLIYDDYLENGICEDEYYKSGDAEHDSQYKITLTSKFIEPLY